MGLVVGEGDNSWFILEAKLTGNHQRLSEERSQTPTSHGTLWGPNRETVDSS